MDTPVTDSKSCYVLEFSVQPGAARLGDVHVYGTLAELRAGFDRRYLIEEYGVDGDLVLWGGAVLYLWAVERGKAVAGIDLRGYLRTGDEGHDRVVQRMLDLSDPGLHELGDIFEDVMWVSDHEPMRAMPTFARLFELYDSRAVDEVRALSERFSAMREANDFPLSDDYPRLALDWKAVEADLPALSGPFLTTGEVAIVWPAEMPPQPKDYIRLAFNEDGVAELHAGLNDLEGGEDEYL